MLKRGTQVACVPDHVQELDECLWLDHEDTEFGFIMDQPDLTTFFCRYWKKGELGRLRTRSCSDLTEGRHLILHESVHESVVRRAIMMIEKEFVSFLPPSIPTLPVLDPKNISEDPHNPTIL